MIGIPASLSLLIHVGILLIKGVMNILRLLSPKYIKATIIMLVVGFFSMVTILGMFHLDASTENNFEYIQNIMKSCPVNESKMSSKNVVLRIDDVQANVWTDISIRMITDAISVDAPVSLGIIPKGLSTDTKLTAFLKQHNCNVEIAQHGWDHKAQDDYSSPEFADLSYEDAKTRIQKGKKELDAISMYPLTTFIPPQNLTNDNTDKALHDLGFNVVSAEGQKYFDYDISPYDWSKKELLPIEDVISACEKEFTKTNLCVVMIHPQDYTTGSFFDVQKYNQYKALLTKLKEQGYNLTTFHQYVQPSKLPPVSLPTRLSNIAKVLFADGIFVVIAILATIWVGFLSLRKMFTKKPSK
jgi:predicted deacetylase